MSKAIEDLTHEHRAVLLALQILEGLSHEWGVSKHADLADAAALVGFLKEFADKCHHGKEEGFLFPAMTNMGVPEEQASVSVLLSEHDKGREWIRAMEAALFPVARFAGFQAAVRGYSELLRAHIEKENAILFPIAEQKLSQAQLDELYEAFEKHEAAVIGQGRHEQLHALLERLMVRYAPPGAAETRQ